MASQQAAVHVPMPQQAVVAVQRAFQGAPICAGPQGIHRRLGACAPKDGNGSGLVRVECLGTQNQNSNLKPEPAPNSDACQNSSPKPKLADTRNPMDNPKPESFSTIRGHDNIHCILGSTSGIT